MIATVISHPNQQINYSVDVPNTLRSDEIVKYLWIDTTPATSDEYIEIDYNGFTTTLLITDECKYKPVDIAFQNKEGALQVITFFKARKDSTTIKSETFESNRPIGNHQFVRFNVNSKTKFTINTGFLPEDKNATIAELLRSERVWMLDGATAIPLNVGTTSLEYKTRVNDKLINYAIDFEYAFNDINNV
jgi:hypothetical protein